MEYIIPIVVVALLGFRVYSQYGTGKQKLEQDVDFTLADIASFLFDDKESDRPTPFKEHIDLSKLDYSLESLSYLDDFLDKIRNDTPKLSKLDYMSLVLRCGAYTGEVIRRNAKTEIHWITYENAVKSMPNLKEFGPVSLATFYVLKHSSTGGLTFPMGKVEKFFDNGREDSVYAFARVMMQSDPSQSD